MIDTPKPPAQMAARVQPVVHHCLEAVADELVVEAPSEAIEATMKQSEGLEDAPLSIPPVDHLVLDVSRRAQLEHVEDCVGALTS